MSKNHFDEMAKDWDGDSLRFRVAEGIAGAIRKHAGLGGGKVLDFGCGTGLVSFMIADQVEEIIGLDSSSGMVSEFNKKAQEYNFPASAALFDPEQEEFPVQGVDAIVSGMVFHHIENIPRLLGQLFHTVKPGGTIAIADLDEEDGTFHPPEMEGIFHKGFSRAQMITWMNQAGFDSSRVFDALTIEKDGNLFSLFLAVAIRPLN